MKRKTWPDQRSLGDFLVTRSYCLPSRGNWSFLLGSFLWRAVKTTDSFYSASMQILAYRSWNLSNWTSVIHYSFGVFFNYSLFFLLVISVDIYYSYFLILQTQKFINYLYLLPFHPRFCTYLSCKVDNFSVWVKLLAISRVIFPYDFRQFRVLGIELLFLLLLYSYLSSTFSINPILSILI